MNKDKFIEEAVEEVEKEVNYLLSEVKSQNDDSRIANVLEKTEEKLSQSFKAGAEYMAEEVRLQEKRVGDRVMEYSRRRSCPDTKCERRYRSKRSYQSNHKSPRRKIR